jgi:hypothetical protein
MDAITGSMSSSSPCKVKVAGIRTTENTAPIIKILLTKGHTLHDIMPRMAVHMDTQHSIPWASWDAVFDIHLDAVTKDVFSSQSAFKLCTQTSFMREAFELSYPRLNVHRIAWATPLERAFNGQAKVYLLVDLPDEKLAGHTLSREIKAAVRERMLDRAYRHYGQFTACPGSLTAMAHPDDEPIVWHLAQQLMFP